MRKNGEGSVRQLSNGKWECIIQSKYTNPDSNSLSPKRIKRTGNTELEAKKKSKTKNNYNSKCSKPKI